MTFWCLILVDRLNRIRDLSTVSVSSKLLYFFFSQFFSVSSTFSTFVPFYSIFTPLWMLDLDKYFTVTISSYSIQESFSQKNTQMFNFPWKLSFKFLWKVIHHIAPMQVVALQTAFWDNSSSSAFRISRVEVSHRSLFYVEFIAMENCIFFHIVK